MLYSKYIIFQFNFSILKILNFNLQFYQKATFQIANPPKHNYNKGEPSYWEKQMQKEGRRDGTL